LVAQDLKFPGGISDRLGVRRSLGSAVRLSVLFFAAYAAINYATAVLQYGRTTITLWSPDDALSVILLLESSLYTPVVLAASIVVDMVFAPAGVGAVSIFVSDLVATLGYLLIAVLLRDAFRFDIRQATYANMIALLAVAPLGAIFTAAIYCGALYLTGALAPDAIFPGIQYFWIGDTVGMIVMIPVAVAVHDLARTGAWRAILKPSRAAQAAALLVGVALLIFASRQIPSDRYLFNLLFLPTIWVGIAYGYNAVAMLLTMTQLLLVATLIVFRVSDPFFASSQTQMFILAATGQLLGAAVTEREQATLSLSRQRADFSRLTAQATTGALAAAFAHEVSQPLSALSGYVHAARRMLSQPEGREGAIGALQKAEAETRRARDIVTRIREFVASGNLELAEEDLGGIAHKIVELNREEARLRKVELTIRAPEAPTLARIDRIAIEQALNNLVVNAIEAVGSGGTVALSVAVEGAFARLAVDDDGPGVSPEIAEHLFEAFETTKPTGMGLGLTLASQIASKHGGRLTWGERAQGGACFVIELPRGDGAADA
jgi:two-component system, LuxR family, sensor kinase FixL